MDDGIDWSAPAEAWACPRCGAMLSVYTLDNGGVYLGCSEPGCLYASNEREGPDDGGDLLDHL